MQIQSEPYPKSLSVTDKSVLHIADQLNACVLSSDKAVRNYARNKEIAYHGMIWIFDQLVDNNYIFKNSQQLVAEIQKRLRQWG